jgi:ribosomal protein RSM22 (predicted rRNA methylase)
MVGVFGGSAISWEATLSTLGASLLGQGARIMIGDLSRRRTTDVLCDLCRRAGRPLLKATLPGSQGAVDLFAGLSWGDLSTVLAEVQHSARQDMDVSRRERQEDRR